MMTLPSRVALVILGVAAVIGALIFYFSPEARNVHESPSSNAARGRGAAEEPSLKLSKVGDLPQLPDTAVGATRWDMIEGLHVERLDGVGAADGQPQLRLTARHGEGRHAIAAAFDGFPANARYRVTVWVKAPAPSAVMIEARDSVEAATGQPANFGMAQFDLVARSTMKTVGNFVTQGIEQAPNGWLRIWADLQSKDGKLFVLLGMLESPRNIPVFKAAGQELIFGGVLAEARP